MTSAAYLTPPIARWLGAPRIDLDACGSTNDEAARLARAGARHGTVVIAASQHAGRGRSGRAWASPPGAGLYLSAVLGAPMTTALALVDVPPMTLAIGIGLCDAIRATGAPALLKWPNDVLVSDPGRGGGRKVAGVLVEAQSQGARLDSVVIGLGVNLMAGALPPELGPIATTLEDATGRAIDREAFIATVLSHVERWLERYLAGGLPAILEPWEERMMEGLVARATIDGATITGEVVGLDDDGALRLRAADGGHHRVRSGEVEVIQPTARDGATGAGRTSVLRPVV